MEGLITSGAKGRYRRSTRIIVFINLYYCALISVKFTIEFNRGDIHGLGPGRVNTAER